MVDKIGFILGKILVWIILIGLIVISAVLIVGIVNRLLVWGFPFYGC